MAISGTVPHERSTRMFTAIVVFWLLSRCSASPRWLTVQSQSSHADHSQEKHRDKAKSDSGGAVTVAAMRLGDAACGLFLQQGIAIPNDRVHYVVGAGCLSEALPVADGPRIQCHHGRRIVRAETCGGKLTGDAAVPQSRHCPPVAPSGRFMTGKAGLRASRSDDWRLCTCLHFAHMP